jgi:4'-phosphopantetheinyl transferase
MEKCMNQVKILIADTQLFINDAKENLSQIAPCYVKKFNNNKIKKEAEQELVTGFLLNKYLGIDQDDQLMYHDNLKPLLRSGNKYFNISHSGDYVALAIADCNVGIDIEKIRTCHEATVNKVYTSKQKEELDCLEGKSKDENFTRMWTELEAKLKLDGIGFGEGWKDKNFECSNVYTVRIENYFITCATEKKVTIMMEKYI